MNYVFEIADKTGREIKLTKRQWKHVIKRHPYMEKYLEEIKETLKIPDKLIIKLYNKGYYYKNYKYLKKPNKFILVVVKYLNRDGFVMSAYFVDKIS